MYIEIATPASIPLGLAQIEGRLCMLGLTVQHPQVQIWAEAQDKMNVTGPRAHIAADQTETYRSHTGMVEQATIEVEETIPAFVGLGGDAHMALGVARAMAWIKGNGSDDTLRLAKDQGLTTAQGLEIWGQDRGGVLLIDLAKALDGEQAILQRETVAHADRDSWAFVMHFPNIPFDTPDTYEVDLMDKVLASAPDLDAGRSATASEQLFNAIRKDDIHAFAAAIQAVQAVNGEAQAAAGMDTDIDPELQNIHELFIQSGCLATGTSLNGDMIFGLVRSGNASRDVRIAVNKALGIFAGTTMATIVDNRGTAYNERPGGLALKELDPYRFLNENK